MQTWKLRLNLLTKITQAKNWWCQQDVNLVFSDTTLFFLLNDIASKHAQNSLVMTWSDSLGLTIREYCIRHHPHAPLPGTQGFEEQRRTYVHIHSPV